MGHRSSKSSAGSTNGNTTTNKSFKLNKPSKRRSAQLKNPALDNSASECAENNFDNLEQFEDGIVGEASDRNDQSSAANQSGQIIIKIQFRRRLSRMENKQSRKSLHLQTAESATTGSQYRHITDSNSNQLPSDGPSVLNVTLNQNFMLNGQLNCPQQRSVTDTTKSGAAGSSRNSLLNNNIEAIGGCINELHISEPLLDASDAAEYCEVLEEPSVSLSNKQASKSVNLLTASDDYSRRQKSKSGFMNLKNMPGASTSKLHRNKDSQQSQSQTNNNHAHSQNIRPHQVSVLSVPLTHSEVITTSSSSNMAALTNPTPISITTSATTSNATLPINNTNGLVPGQVSIWGTHSRTGVIIPINSQVVVVCPHKSVLTLGSVNDDGIRLMTEIVGSGTDRESTNLTTVQSNMTQPQSFLVKSTHNGPIVHSQVDFVHCLVPDLERIINSSFYWGKMDRYEAERLLDGKTEGTFLLRDSAQEEYLFSVTFRKYGRSLHARIEQSGHKFSFDSHDQCVFTAPTVTGLLEHYKDPACVMFFEPMLTIPFHRKTAFSLQELARATIVSHTTYDGINQLELPVRLKAYLKEYHYKQKLRVKPFDDSFLSCT